jgi:phosphatidylglycerophosphatase A
MRRRIPLLLASGIYLGLIPGAPGTYASMATTAVFFLFYRISYRIAPELHISIVCLVSLVGVWAATAVARQRGVKDPSVVVIDEVAGQLVTFAFLPVTAFNLLTGTLLFRVMDIFKPFPIRRLEQLEGGVGIMADDLLAGVYANLILQLANRYWGL